MCIRDSSYIGSLASEKHPDYLQKLNFLEEILDSNSYREKDEYFPRTEPVSYTHLDVYKRQVWHWQTGNRKKQVMW